MLRRPSKHSRRTARLKKTSEKVRAAAMPVSKRDRVIHTSKVKKHDKSEKVEQIDHIRESISEMRFTYVVSVSNERNNILKSIRDELKPGKMFYSKNKVAQVAIGFRGEAECAEGIHPLSALLVGQSALITTNIPKSELMDLLVAHEEPEFARAGGIASQTLALEEGFDALSDFPHSMETQFRKLGLPTQLYDGKIKVLANHIVCREGDVLTAAQAQILKLFKIQMAKFEMIVKAVYDKETSQVTVF
jgi:mRNA turnover protein 4